MKTSPLELSGLVLVTPNLYRDGRGFFLERFNKAEFAKHGLPTEFYQDNHSRSLPGVLRGMHFQRDPAQGKLIGVTRGQIWDVAIDLRNGSATFGHHLGITLSADSGQMLWIPAGFAHGFCVLGDESADVLYKVDARYNPATECGIRWDDPDLAINWPLAKPIVSDRDLKFGTFADYKAGPMLY